MSQLPDSSAPVITIDGPGGSGKGTVSALIARKLGWTMLDSGALYRVIAYAALKNSVPLDDTQGLENIAKNLDLRFEASDTENQVYLATENVTRAIRTEEAGNAASKVAAVPEVRTALLDRQKAFQQMPGLVADGRDMGTVVFPDAKLKLFLTASAEERAKRRHKQLMEKGVSVNMRDLFDEITERDKRDSERSTAPLKAADDAVTLDTTNMNIQQVVDEILRLYAERL